jgi:hypothetical protein
MYSVRGTSRAGKAWLSPSLTADSSAQAITQISAPASFQDMTLYLMYPMLETVMDATETQQTLETGVMKANLNLRAGMGPQLQALSAPRLATGLQQQELHHRSASSLYEF